MRQARRAAALLAAAGIVACRGQAVPLAGRHVTPDSAFAALVDSLVPAVEQAAGVRFRSPPRSAVRTRDQVRAYLAAKLDHDLPPSRARNLARAYQLLRLLPDSVNLRRLLLDLLAEQVVGYYDPDSATLFGVAGAPPEQLRLMAAHEMVHALQGQYLNLDSLLAPGGDNDRATAAQSILEGQAMLGSLRALLPAVDILGSDSLWHELRTQAVAAERSAPRFGAAPLIVREGLVFPYLDGAEFMRWWGRTPAGQADSMPWGARMPVSTEQILHPDRYARGDRPVRLRFRGGPAADSVLQEDALGEMEIGVMLALAAGAPQPVYQPALGWGGDRYRLYGTPGGPALVWEVVFDDAASAAAFLSRVTPWLGQTQRPGYRAAVTAVSVGSRPGVRYVVAPGQWTGWHDLPVVEVAADR